MDEAQTAANLKAIGKAAHYHDGVWWQQVAPGFCKPVDVLRTFAPGSARPTFSRRWLGYSHVVPDDAPSNHAWNVMYLEGEGLQSFDLTRVSPKRKQQKIKQAIKTLDIRLIEEIEPLLPAMNEINAVMARRTGHGHSPEYYSRQRAEWERFMIREFSLPGREWWGAFHEARLVAYYYAYVVARTLHISAAKSHTDFLRLGPNDGLVFTLLHHHAQAGDCDRVIYGDWSPEVPTLNEFNECYGFRQRSLPIFRAMTPIMRLARRWKNRRSVEPTQEKSGT